MAQLDMIRETDRQKVATSLGPLLNELNGPQLGGLGAPMQLGASLSEIMMAPSFFTDQDPKAGLRSTGETLSLIETPDDHPTLGGAGERRPAVGYARHKSSEDSDNADVKVTTISSSDLGQRISDGYDWIEKNVDGDPLVRVILAPAYQMTLLGLYDEDELTKVYVVTPPSAGASVERGALYDVGEFRKRMRSHPVAMGLDVPDEIGKAD